MKNRSTYDPHPFSWSKLDAAPASDKLTALRWGKYKDVLGSWTLCKSSFLLSVAGSATSIRFSMDFWKQRVWNLIMDTDYFMTVVDILGQVEPENLTKKWNCMLQWIIILRMITTIIQKKLVNLPTVFNHWS